MKPDNKFFSFMSLVGDLILLNILFIVTSIPIVTLGISFSALYASVQKRIRGKESYVIKDYFSLWKSNARNGLILWLILLPFLAAMLFFTIYIAGHLTSLIPLCLYFILFIILAFVLAYVFPLQATFINTPLNLLKNSLLTALAHLPYTLALIFIISIPICVTLYFPAVFYYTFAYWVVLGFSITAVISVLITERVFRHYMADQGTDFDI